MAIRALSENDHAHARYYASLAVLSQKELSTLSLLGEGHEVTWLFFEDSPLRPIVLERIPNWSRLVMVDIEAQTILWKAQLYRSQTSVAGTIGAALKVEQLGAVFKSGDRSKFERAFGYQGRVLVYRHLAPIGVISKTVYEADGRQVPSTYLVSSSEKLRAIGFP
ncbi:MAG: hypothetical protein ACR2HJ_08420 [Fimbriimonadales bacterium]